MDQIDRLLRLTAELAIAYLSDVDERPVAPLVDGDELRGRLGGPLPEGPEDPAAVVRRLAESADPGVVAVGGGRYFGFVTGGELPAALAADWLATAWDQNAFSFVSSPAASVVEEVTAGWIKELLGLPASSSTAFVTGCQMAHVTCLAAARARVLGERGWNVAERGLAGAPPLRIVTGALRHMTVDRALRLLGIGTDALELVDVDDDGRMVPGSLARVLGDADGPTIVVAQAGEVNTGVFDPIDTVADLAAAHGAWLHIDGAFGIWARVSPSLRHHVAGLERADSWAFDAHKWLNVPYDSGIAICAHPEAHRAAMGGSAAYLPEFGTRYDAFEWTPDASRRARGLPVYAAVSSLGRRGIAEMVDRCCAHARALADGLAGLPGAVLLNEVELNQVLIRFGDDETTREVLRRVQESGEAWMGSTRWRGRAAIRISVSSWRTTADDVARTVAAFAAAVG